MPPRKRRGVRPTQGRREQAVGLESASAGRLPSPGHETPQNGRMRVAKPTTRQRTPAFGFGLAEWLGLAALAFGSLHILLDAGVGLFPTQGPASAAMAAVFVLSSLILVWWAVSIAAAASGQGGGLASVAVLTLGWTLLTNGYPIVYCPPPC